MNILYKTL